MKEYIEREAAIEFVKSLIDTMSVCTSIDECLGMKSMKNRALCALRDVPAADVVEVRHGHWIEDACGAIWCSNCSHAEESCEQKMYRYRYCPNCGAKMDGGADDAAD
jgi:hypothetical protein